MNQYPTSSGPPPVEDYQAATAPQSVLTAVRLMYAGAALSAIETIVAVVTVGSLKTAILSKNHTLTSTQIHATEVFIVAAAVIGGVIGIALWLWMAWANGKGKNWARILSTVFFGFNTLGLLSDLVQAHVVLTLILAVLVWLVGLGAVIMMWRKESGPYYHQPPQFAY